MNKQPKFDFDRNERRAAIDRLAEVYRPPKGSCTSLAACIRVLRCIESHLGRQENGALADEWRLTVETIAAETGMSDRTIRYAIFQLEREQFLYIVENRKTGWRSHVYRIIWGNIEAASEIKTTEPAKEEKPTTVERGDRKRGVATTQKAPLQLAPKPLQLGSATVATRSSNHCNSSIQNKELNKKPPPPPTPSNPQSVSPPTAWREVEEVLRTLGIGQAREATRNARERIKKARKLRAKNIEKNYFPTRSARESSRASAMIKHHPRVGSCLPCKNLEMPLLSTSASLAN